MTRKIKIAFHGRYHFFTRDSILRFIVGRPDSRFELCAEGDSRCDAIVISQPEARLFFDQPTEWDRLVREIGSTDRKPIVILDCSSEGWQPPKAFREKVAKTLQDKASGIRRVVFLTQRRLLFRDGEVHRSHGASQIEYLYFHGWLARIAAELRRVMEKDGGACLENMFANRVEAWKSPSPRFVCLMRKPRPHRIVVMGHLIRTGALRHGNVSFLSSSRLPRRRIKAGWTLESEIAHAREQFPRFLDEVDALAGFPEAKHDFRNFEDDADSHSSIGIGANASRLRSTFPAIYASYLSIGIGANASRDTQVELVVETEMGDESSRRFTEKSLKAPLLWHAFLICGNLSTLPLLEEVGIRETGFGGDYDSVRGQQERLKAVLDTFDDYLSGSLQPDEGYLWRNRDIHARFLAKAEENAARSMNILSQILLDEL